MKTHRLEMEDHDGLIFVVGAADPDLNTFYDAASKVFLTPVMLRLSLGRVSEEEQLKLAMRTYACGVILGTEPEMSERAVFEWLQKHPAEFDIIVSIADHRENFTEDGDSTEAAGTTPGPGVEETG